MAAGSPGPVVPDRYLEALGDADPVAAMAEAPDLLRRLARGLTERQLATRPARGKWSIREIVARPPPKTRKPARRQATPVPAPAGHRGSAHCSPSPPWPAPVRCAST